MIFRASSVHKVPTVFQMESTECGAASLGMILAYYHCYEPLEKLRVACGVSRNGSKASLILRAAEKYHLEGHGYRVTAAKLNTLPYPSILFWNAKHYVVYEGQRGSWFYINDPARGRCRYSAQDFEKAFSNIALTFKPTADFHAEGRARGVFRTLFPLLLKVKSVGVLLLWSGILLIVPGILMPAMLQIFIDEVMTTREEWLYPLLIAYALTLLVSAILSYLTQYVLRRGQIQMAVNSSVRMLRHIFSLPMEFFVQRNSADLQARFQMNTQLADGFFELVANNVVKLFTASFFLFLMYQFSAVLAGIALLTAMFNFILLSAVNRSRQTINQALSTAEIRLLNQSMSGISLMESLRAGGRDQDFYGKWANSLAEYTNKRLLMQKSGTFFSLVPALLSGFNQILILCFGAWLVIRGNLTLGGMMAFQSLTASFMQPVTLLVSAGSQIQELKGAQDRIEDVMHYPAESRFAGESGNKVVRGKLELRDITFGYSRLEEPFIRNFSLTLRPGCRIALVGASGSGKSTIARIASGLYAPWSGEILLDDVPLEKYTREEFNRAVASVDQTIVLFSGSVGDNLTLFRRGMDAGTLLHALRDAAIEKELAARGQPLSIEVNENGSNFSGGQRQRLEIARALARNTPILILDEASSALDPVTEVMIDNAMRRRGCSCLIIAHRLSTIRDCDEIIMMDSGRIVERGTYEELMRLGGAYASLMNAENKGGNADADF